jgi:hypothetical protein
MDLSHALISLGEDGLNKLKVQDYLHALIDLHFQRGIEVHVFSVGRGELSSRKGYTEKETNAQFTCVGSTVRFKMRKDIVGVGPRVISVR